MFIIDRLKRWRFKDRVEYGAQWSKVDTLKCRHISQEYEKAVRATSLYVEIYKHVNTGEEVGIVPDLSYSDTYFDGAPDLQDIEDVADDLDWIYGADRYGVETDNPNLKGG